MQGKLEDHVARWGRGAASLRVLAEGALTKDARSALLGWAEHLESKAAAAEASDCGMISSEHNQQKIEG